MSNSLEEFYNRSTPKCPYCGEEFETENAEGVHRAEKHVREDKPVGDTSTGFSIVDDWKGQAEAVKHD